MAADARILLYGDTVLLAGIRAQLASCQTLHLLPVRAGCTCLPLATQADTPRLLLFDLAVTTADAAIALLRAHPDLVLIGVDSAREESLVLTCRSVAALSVAGVVDVILESAQTCHTRKGCLSDEKSPREQGSCSANRAGDAVGRDFGCCYGDRSKRSRS